MIDDIRAQERQRAAVKADTWRWQAEQWRQRLWHARNRVRNADDQLRQAEKALKTQEAAFDAWLGVERPAVRCEP